MIKHISLYKVNDINKIDYIVERLKELKDCPLVIDNYVNVSLTNDLPDIKGPIFANVIHQCYFKDEQDAMAYPVSSYHMDLVKDTNEYMDYIMAIDCKE